ncbi:putative reverse transcriptase/RNA-dependent DNA polymerase [Citrus sinensis]|nr:putative reverse transcriptase/RNA-dependent DNA polymerase [Citrus sinensis]
MSLKFKDQPSSSTASPTEWSVIWKLEIPEKVKVFMWRAAQDLLPTAGNLWKKKALQDPWCQRCGKKGENVFHALIKCKLSQKVWNQTKFKEDLEGMENQDMFTAMKAIAEKRNTRDVALFVSLCWAIWHSRNLFIFERRKEDPRFPVARAEATIEVYRKVKVPQMQIEGRQKSNHEQTWKPPPEGYVKVNTDAAIYMEEQKVGLGIIIRDSKGDFVAAAMKMSKFIDNIAYAEAEAIHLGMNVAEAVARGPVIVESDCSEVVNQILGRTGSNLELLWIISDIKKQMQKVKDIKMQFIPRICNGAAHDLAKMALKVNDYVQWVGTCPPHLLYLFS